MTKYITEEKYDKIITGITILEIISFGTLISIIIMANLRSILPDVTNLLVLVCLVSIIISVLVLYICSLRSKK